MAPDPTPDPTPDPGPTPSRDAPGAGEWLGISAAGRRLGISPKAVRGRVKRGTLRWRAVGNTGREVYVGPDVAGGVAPATRDVSQDGPRVTELLALLGDERAARARVEGELVAMVALVAELRARAERSETNADRLAADLAELRRPWLARVLEGLRRR